MVDSSSLKTSKIQIQENLRQTYVFQSSTNHNYQSGFSMVKITLTQIQQSSTSLTHIQRNRHYEHPHTDSSLTGHFYCQLGKCQVVSQNSLKIHKSTVDPSLAAAQLPHLPPINKLHTATAHSITDTAISLRTVPICLTYTAVYTQDPIRVPQTGCKNTLLLLNPSSENYFKNKCCGGEETRGHTQQQQRAEVNT